METRSQQIDDSTDELVKLVKHHVEDILEKYYLKHGIRLGYELRDDTVFYVCDIINKKYHNNTKFKEHKDKYIRVIAQHYLFAIYNNLQTPK